ncbi:MAG: hypothetical protein IPJ19_17720 [Planctomycetes bacterium]|nr:hypothetical protein [Planctomycetota bacterium]
MLAIQGRALNKKEPLFPEFTIQLPPEVERGASGITLRALLADIVRNEVEAFDKRQSERRFLRTLTERQIQAAAQKGRITMGESEVPRVAVDTDVSIATACQAFEDGLFLVFLDEVEHKQLDAQVFPKPDSCLMFVRLSLLVGS